MIIILMLGCLTLLILKSRTKRILFFAQSVVQRKLKKILYNLQKGLFKVIQTEALKMEVFANGGVLARLKILHFRGFTVLPSLAQVQAIGMYGAAQPDFFKSETNGGIKNIISYHLKIIKRCVFSPNLEVVAQKISLPSP